jgi:hypothetical protein
MSRNKDADLSTLDLRPVFAEIVNKAVQLGWRVVRGETNQSLLLTSAWHEGPPITIVLPIKERSINAATMRGWYDKLTRYAKPDTIQAAAEGTTPPPVTVEEPIERPTPPPMPKPPTMGEKAAEMAAKVVPTTEPTEVVPEERICRLCKLPSTWSSPAARAAHSKIHRREGREAALQLIMVTAQDALGVAIATPAEFEELRLQLTAEQTAHRTTIDALEATRKELEAVKGRDGELRAALDLLRGALS